MDDVSIFSEKVVGVRCPGSVFELVLYFNYEHDDESSTTFVLLTTNVYPSCF